jgi:hypothetical protein
MNIRFSIGFAQVLAVVLLIVNLTSAFPVKGGFLSRRRSAFLSKSKSSIGAEDTEEGNGGISEGIIGIPTLNVLGGRLQACCFKPKTGFYRVCFTVTTSSSLKVESMITNNVQRTNKLFQYLSIRRMGSAKQDLKTMVGTLYVCELTTTF